MSNSARDIHPNGKKSSGRYLRIIYVGVDDPVSTSGMRLRAMRELGHDVVSVSPRGRTCASKTGELLNRARNRLGYPPNTANVNESIIRHAAGRDHDLLWVDELRMVTAGTLKLLKAQTPSIIRVSLIMDDPFSRRGRGWRRFKQAVPYYDIHYIIRDVNNRELRRIGARRVERYHKGFDLHTHRPVNLPEDHPGHDVLFIGHYEPPREKAIAFLIERGVPVTVIGCRDAIGKRSYWRRIERSAYIQGGVYGQDYTKAICSAKIALCFYSRWNRDTENSKMYEIPACGTFMLAERNRENVKMFEEGKEAEFFSSREELMEKVKYYLSHPDERRRIAEAGGERCMKSGYSYHERLKKMLRTAVEAVEK